MSFDYSHLSTGLPGLDRVIKGLLPGDNIVWQVNSIAEYRRFVGPYVEFAGRKNQTIIYFRFAKHEPLLIASPDLDLQIHNIDPAAGFEPFISAIHAVIKKNGHGGYYVFDCLSELTTCWYSDRMLGNFFMLTCPYLLDMEALAYFCVLRKEHSSYALFPIQQTAQVVLDVYTNEDHLYVHPLKVQQRYSPTMHMLHREENQAFLPVTNSAMNSRILSFAPLQSGSSYFEEQDIWSRTLVEASHCSVSLDCPESKRDEYRRLLLRMLVTREDNILSLCLEYFSLEDLLETGRRMIGTGLIGGKSTGMLLARAMLKKDNPALMDSLEIHDSFYVGADVFYTYMVVNGCWWIRHQQKEIESFLSVAEYARRLILTGKFPEDMVRKFSDMLDYFGQSPIIVRSSSLLEDNFGNAFSGKYESIFCPNQGSREKRLENLMIAIRTIYASTLSEKALEYRAHLGILEKDEQMPLLIQRVSGDLHGTYFFPAVGGVGYSFNPYVWDKEIDPESGVIRIVYGMGTRAVDRSDDDYTRVVALNAPEKRPESGMDEIRRYSQKRIDVIDLEANQLVSAAFDDIAPFAFEVEKQTLTSLEEQTNSNYISFSGLFRDTAFIDDMRAILSTLEKAYSHAVDVEFTLNFTEGQKYKINVVQCRPFEAKRSAPGEKDLFRDDGRKPILSADRGTVIGRSCEIRLDRIVYVSSKEYAALTAANKYQTARLIGSIMKKTDPKSKTVLIGPGRWGTSTVFLGIPVKFSDISRAACLCEIVEMSDNLVPDVSLGTHFFNDLVEFDILYLAHYPKQEGSIFNTQMITDRPNLLNTILSESEAKGFLDVIRVVDCTPGELVLAADIFKQRFQLYEK